MEILLIIIIGFLIVIGNSISRFKKETEETLKLIDGNIDDLSSEVRDIHLKIDPEDDPSGNY
jgi:hypothetical protein